VILIRAVLGIVLGLVALTFGLSLVLVLPVWLLWNWIGVSVLGGPALTFWQVWGTLLLFSLLAGVLRTKVS